MKECLFISHPQPRDTGDYLHRTLWPAQALGQHLNTIVVQTSHPEALKMALESTLLVINMIADEIMLEVVRWRNAHGLVTVYEISDDFESFPIYLPNHGFYSSPQIQALIRQLASEASAVQFSSPALLEKYGALNRRSTCFLNQCQEIPPLADVDGQRRPVVIGWAGSGGHQTEVRLLIEWLKQWQSHARQEEIAFAVMANPEISALFTDAQLNPRLTPTGTMQDYFHFISGLDIGLAMIGEDDFSLGRSDGKFLEYASHGVVAVCSDRGSYKHTIVDGVTGFLFQTREQFWESLDRALQPDLRLRVRRQAHDYILNQRTHEADAVNRLEFYRQLGSELSAPQQSAQAGFVEAVHPQELHLYAAMAAHATGDLRGALTKYHAVLENTPNFYLPWLRLSELLAQLGAPDDSQMCTRTAETLLQQTFRLE